MPECEFKKFCQYVNDEFNCDDPDDYFGCEYAIMMSKVQEETTMLFVGYIDKKSPQFKKQYAKLSDVEKVLRGLPVWQDDFQLEKVLNLIRRIE